MAIAVDVGPAEAAPVAIVRRRARQDELSRVVPAACGVVWNFIRASGFKRAGRNVAIYLDGVINLEAGVEVEPPFEGTGDVMLSATPAGIVAHAIHIGSYADLGRAHEAIRAWGRTTGRSFAGPSWEIYGHWTDDLTRLRTDVYLLLEA
jgi:effector-binding domain-containing protein